MDRLAVTICAFFLVVWLLPANAQPACLSESAEKAFGHIFNLDFENADNVIASIGDGSDKIWLCAYSSFVKSLSRYETPNPDFFASQIRQIRQYADKSPVYLQRIIDIYLMKCYAHFLDKSYVSATSAYLKAKQHVEDIVDADQDSWQARRFELLRLAVDAQMQKVLPILADDKTAGQRADEYGRCVARLLADEAVPTLFKNEIKSVSLLLLPLVCSPEKAGCAMLDSFGADWPYGSATASYVAVAQLESAGQSALALKVLRKADSLGYNKLLNLLNLKYGCQLLNAGNDSCSVFLNQFIECQANQTNVLYAKMKLAWHFFLNGDTVKAESLCGKIIQSPATTPNDFQAKYECSLFDEWNARLIRARLLFDAGFYDECISSLVSVQTESLTPIQANEYAYRMGRACHKLKKYAEAKEYYQKAIDRRFENIHYYPCYSAFYMGIIYRNEGNSGEAEKYFRACMKMDSPIYGDEIHQKAKNAMK